MEEESCLNSFDLSIKRILIKTIKFYKANFRLLIKFFIIIFIINFLIGIVNNCITRPLLQLGISFIGFILKIMIISALMMFISNKYNGLEINFKEILKITKHKFVSYMKAYIKFILGFYTIFLIIFYLYYLIKLQVLKYLLIVVVVLIGGYLITINWLGPIIVVLDNEKNNYFKISRNLVENNFWKVFLLTLFLGLIISIPQSYLINQKSVLGLSKFRFAIFTDFIYSFLIPLFVTLNVVLYNRLKVLNNK